MDMGASRTAVNDELRGNRGVGSPVNATGVHSDIGESVDVRLRLGLEATVVVLSHDNSSWSQAENEFSAKWSVSSSMALGETPAPATAKANVIHINTQYWNPLSSDFTKIAVKCIISPWN